MKKKKNQQNNLNEVIRFDAQPTVQVDRVTVNEPVALPEGCGEGDFRANSVECGQPAKPLPIDVAEKAAGAIGALQDSNAGKEKAAGRLFLSGIRRGSMLPNVMRLHVSRGASPKPQDPPGYQRKRRQETSGGQLRWSAPPWWEMPNRVGELAEGYDARQSALIGQAEAALKALSAHGGGGGVPGR